MSKAHAWDVYAKELFPQGHGYPLWDPDIDPGLGWEVEIADVGWVRDRMFQHLLRCKSRQEEGRELPESHEPFTPPNATISGPRAKITQPVLCSRSIKSVDFSGGASVNIAPLMSAPGGNIKFQCTKEQGALLLLNPIGEETHISCRQHIITYIYQHIDGWVRFANDSLGLGKGPEEFFFVCGVTKTRRWGVAAFRGERRGIEASVSCDLGTLGSTDISLSFSETNMPLFWHGRGPHSALLESQQYISSASPAQDLPSDSTSTSQGLFQTGSSTSSVSRDEAATGSSTSSLPVFRTEFIPGVQIPTGGQGAPGTTDKANQCIFFHYYKAKRRLWLFPQRIEAGAGPHELPPKEDDSFAGEGVQATSFGSDVSEEFDIFNTAEAKPYDPVNAVLDYILENSHARLAIASDRDLYALFKDQEFPDDVAAALARLRPAVESDENDVGTLSVGLVHDHKRVAEEGLEVTASKKRATSPADVSEGENAPDSMDVEYIDAQPSRISGVAADAGTLSPTTAHPLVGLEMYEVKERLPHAMGQATTHHGSITALAYSADGQYLATGAEDACIIIWYARDRTVIRKLVAHDNSISALAFSPSGALLASASEEGPVKLWRIDAFDQPPQEVDVDVFNIRSLAFTPHGLRLLGGSLNGAFLVWDVGSLARVDIAQHEAVITFIVFSPDGTLVATGGGEELCCIWEVNYLDNGGTPKNVLVSEEGTVVSASFSPDGRRLITGSDDASCCIWSTETGLALLNLHEHAGPVWSVAFSPDGKRVASGSSDSTVKVCDAWTGERLLSLEALNSMITSVAYSPDGLCIASASKDAIVRLWNAADGELVRLYNEHSDGVTALRFSPDGSTLTSGARDGTVYIRSLAGLAM